MPGTLRHGFELRPFGATSPSPDLRLEGEVSREGVQLRLRYRLRGAIETVQLPPPAASPTRRDGLWTTTCFECFWGVQGERPYWELNLSPAGHWNLYRLEDYRQGLRPEPDYDRPLHRVSQRHGVLSMDLDLPLPAPIPSDAPLEVAIAGVIEDRRGQLSYWALAHPGAEPDFHRRDAFLLRL
ncbi:DOMON-like domain-containing protein [Cyanobium sp. N.Huapi 1H5]|uniref:DOMON-like domain-containing protein n=1 Tax=Cyanobium sp. N.Huapi 1H5 TaxID=2823719 RepID=UPI0020CD1B72|nr:DOMON-like domain-containing protein [Cyanobium sp. N.Huapi 1H5]MCP9838584.1 DOMON-like domain-containing protein [Cyanobium sp. N.Huapi 1H5]